MAGLQLPSPKMSKTIISLCIEQIDPSCFEIWAQEVLAKTIGWPYEPTGGMHDGGQDGFVRSASSEPTHFVQISKQVGTSSKIRKTIRRLRKKRKVAKLTYVTSQCEAERDILEATLSNEFGIQICIHDQRWLMARASSNKRLKQNLFGYCKEIVDGLNAIQSSTRKWDDSARLSIVAYLEAHVRSLPGTLNFQTICLDTMIYNSLSDSRCI